MKRAKLFSQIVKLIYGIPELCICSHLHQCSDDGTFKLAKDKYSIEKAWTLSHTQFLWLIMWYLRDKYIMTQMTFALLLSIMHFDNADKVENFINIDNIVVLSNKIISIT